MRLTAIALGIILSAASSLADVRVALVSDPHCSTDPKLADYVANFDAVIAQVNAAKPDVVLVTGDLTQAFNEPSAEVFKAKAKGFVAPVRWVGGNHDLGQRADKGKPSTVTAERVKKFEAALGPSFWAEDVLPGVRVIGIAGSLFGSGLPREAEQWAFLEASLKEPAKKTTLVISHYPPFNRKPDEKEEYFNLPPADRERLLGLLKQGKVTAFLSGHLHYPIDLNWEGIPLVGAPAVSFGLPKGVQREGWKLVTIGNEGKVTSALHWVPRSSTRPAAANAPASRPASTASKP